MARPGLLWSIVAVALLAGCAELPLATGPSYALAPGPLADPAAVLPIEVRDVRPAWERQYRAPSQKPEGYRRAIGFLPLENFDPPLTERFRAIVERHAAAQPVAPTWGEIEIRSFRVVVNNVEKLRLRYEELCGGANSRTAFGIGVSDSDAVTVGFSVGMGTPDRFGPRFGPHHPLPPHPIEQAAFEQNRRSIIADGKRLLIGPPDELPMHYGPGVTCSIDASVALHWSDGRSGTYDIRIVRESNPPDVIVYEAEHDIVPTVEAVVIDFDHQLERNIRENR